VLLFVSAFSDLFGYTIIKVGYKSNLPVGNIYILPQFFLISYIFSILLKKKQMVYITAVFYIVSWIFNTIFVQPLQEFQSWSSAIANIILICYSLWFYILMLEDLPTFSVFKFFPFWLNTAVFYYFGATFLIFLSTNYIIKTESEEFGMLFWVFHNVSNIIKNILFAIAIYYAGVKQEKAKGAVSTN
jgi:hypothetical protein